MSSFAARLLGLLLAAHSFAPSPCVAAGGAFDPHEELLRSRLLRAPFGERLSPPDPNRSPTEIARHFLRSRLDPPGELALVGLVEGAGGVRFLSFEQRFDQRPVRLSRSTVAVDAEGAVVAARLGVFAPAGPVPLGSSVLLPDAASARAWALSSLTYSSDALPAGLRDEGPARATLVPTIGGAVPAFSVRLAPPEDPSAVEELLLAQDDGRLLHRFTAHFDGVEGARTWPSDPSEPSEWVVFPDPVTNPSALSPLGWVDGMETAGNNVSVFLDRDGTLDPALGILTQADGDPLVFDFPYTGDPLADADAAVTNVFWALNFAHDRFRLAGFDEASGAMQQDNHGRGGLAGDALRAGVQFRSIDGTVATNLVRLSTGGDGSAATMQVGLFTDRDSGVTKDAAFETDILLHEYAHAVAIRMIEGDAACLNGLQPRALAEGWSDFFASSFTDDPVVSAWLADNPVSGLRAFALDVSPLSYLNFCGGVRGCNAFDDGSIWAATLWDIRELFVAELGPEGVLAAERLIVEALRYTNCQPTFLDARDAILLADELLHGGQHWCALHDLFALRGLGVNAATTGPGDSVPTPGFAGAAACSGSITVSFDRAVYGPASEVLVEVGDPSALPGATVRVESSSGDSELLLLEALPGGPRLRARVVLEAGGPSPGDGLLQVSDGDLLTATHEAGEVSATASVSADLPMDYLIHLVLASYCQAEPDDDHADAPGYFIPGFLDAGEVAEIVFAFASRSPAELHDATVTVTSLNPNVGILPSSPLPLGTIPAAAPGGFFTTVFRVVGAANDSVVAGEQAELRFLFESEGRSTERSVTLTLNMDYVLETGVSPFAGGVETFDADSPTRAAWTHQANRPGPDGWLLADCAGKDSTPGAGNTDAGCVSYPDDQGAPSLLSPPLLADLPDDAAYLRHLSLEWEQDVRLFVDPRRPDLACEADLVALFLTDDPASLPYDDPLGVLLGGAGGPLATWTFLDDTEGFEPATAPLSTAVQFRNPAFDYDRLRLAFVFWSDIVDQSVEPRCPEAANEGHFLLDNVRYTYEYVRVVPEATPCTGGCAVLLDLVVPEPGPHCAGSAFTLDASVSEAVNCPGELVYSFTGPGVPAEYALTTESSAPAVAADDALYTVTASCDALPSCFASRELRNPAPQSPALGGPFPGTVRARRDDADVLLSWIGAAGPPAYGVWRASSRAELVAGLDTWPLVGTTDEESLSGEAEIRLVGAADEPGVAHYRVLGRNLCTDEPLSP